jgi:hypothetical protein
VRVAVGAGASAAPSEPRSSPGEAPTSGDIRTPPPASERRDATSFEVTPPDAAIWWDGKRLAGGDRVPTDGRTHTLRIAAPGYEAVERTVLADRPQSFVISLAALPAPSPGGVARPAPSASAPRQHGPAERVAEIHRESAPPERATEGHREDMAADRAPTRAPPTPGPRAAPTAPAIIVDPNGL